MLVEALLDTEIGVHYGFLVLRSAQTQDDEDSDRDAWRGQANGLVGAAVPEVLRIRTETHTGQVRVRIELHDSAPKLDGGWPEVVEAGFATWVDDLTLSAFDEFDGPVSLPPGSYQVRYHARTVEGSAGEECLLQFWPAAGTDRIVRQTGQSAAHWHRDGVEAPWTAEQLSARVEELRSNQELFDEQPPVDDQDLPHGWPYHHLLSSLGSAGQSIGHLDPVLAVHLTTAEPATLRAVAGWAVEQALTIAGIRDVPGADEALAAVRRGAGLPPGLPAPEQAFPYLLDEFDSPGAQQRFRTEFGKRVAWEQLHQAAGPADVETTCSILAADGRLTGGRPDWIVAAVRQVFPGLVPADR